ncbi:Na+-transporting NADH:ubiquinone oxidoreductase subunit C [Acetoanaerobium pronyense]|uniref:Na+-transporting NADH:ubiquinone oxidoreductase subunit C n=1 Tax=Acetoanaerobium pronyense TaxID=1482736 RepID=A0ABS4KKD4_9FIRM|nr:FMN-binding protein [Acetoanaerobium pronyense]MBP2028244.1 Na+-transporting NADH:ubiquinone oxidoreductase subunit C [Acetoanaerobium pronyense]
MSKGKTKKTLFYPVAFMVAMSMIMSLALATLNQVTYGIIKEQEENQTRRSILSALGLESTSDDEIERIFRENMSEQMWNEEIYYIYSEGNEEVAYVFPILGSAVWGSVEAFGAMDKERTTLLGVDFVRHSETPGLGGRIEDDWYKEQFRGIDITGDMPYVVYRPAPEGNVDTISGATSTSNAVLALINENIHEFKNFKEEGGA